MNDREYLEIIVKGLVEFSDAVSVDRKTDDMGVLLSVSVDKADMGKVIGREGNIANSIRVLVRAFGMKNSARLNVKILEPNK